MQVRWYGHASFRLSSPSQGKAVFLDPFGVPTPEMANRGFQFAYPPIRAAADLVLVTHDHFDHNAVEAVGGGSHVVRAAAGTFDTPIGNVTGVVGDHDTVAGTQRGLNVIYVFSLDGLRVCHFGDYGQSALRPEQEKAIGDVDILMLPVGGGPTIDAAAAAEVVRRLTPRWVVPMHYRSAAINFLDPADAFLSGFEHVERLTRPEFDTADLPGPSGSGPVVLVPAVPT
jgi:L-ascorbate metabolism protein UlaG (beta-lactamase superfamily)